MKNYPKPINFDATNSDFDVFKNIPEGNYFEGYFKSEIKFLENVRISTNSVVFNYFKIFRDSCISEENYQKYQNGFRFFFKFIFPKFNFSKKRFLLITDEWTSNYYHWHVFALKKLLILKEKNLLENSLLFLPKKYQNYPFVFPSLAKFGIKKEQIIFLCRKSNIKTKELALVNAPQQHQQYFEQIRKTLRNDFEANKKIYVSREDQVLRFIENEQEVSDLLAQYGFKKIIAEKLSYAEQIAIFSKTKYLVSPHGAGLTNIFFMPEDSSILELATELPTADYYKLSALLRIKYFYQKCNFGSRSKIKDPHHGSLLVDLEKLEKNLKLMLA